MRIFSVLFFALIKISAFAQVDKSLIAYFSFDDCNIVDVVGNGNTAQVNGSPACACGVSNKSLRLDGVSDEVFFLGNISNSFQNADFSLSFYFKPSVQLGNEVLFSKREDCNDDHAFSVNFTLASSTLTVLMSESSTDKVLLTSKLNKDVCWQHVVITRQNRTHRLYVNGKLLSEGISNKRLKLGNNDPFHLGSGPCPGQLNYKGDIDEIRVYNRAIEPDFIQTLFVKPDQIANFDTLIYLGGKVPIKTTETCASSYSWKPTAGVADITSPNTTLSPLVTTTYTLQFNTDGCIASDTILIKVVDPSTIPCDQVFLPKAFTPNGDGLNDEFGISNQFVIKTIKSFEIFDSWGGKMFTTTDVFTKWDGTFNGSAVMPGVYLYRVLFDCGGEEKVQQGSITLLR